MDSNIAKLAKTAPFDAAHYTWVFVATNVVEKYPEDKLNRLLVAHGDYATPLYTKDLCLPFENLAVVVELVDPGEHALVTVDCTESHPKYIKFWAAAPTDGTRLALTVNLRPTKEQRDHYNKQTYNKDLLVPDDSDTHALFDFNPGLSHDMKAPLLEYGLWFGHSVLRYIAAASDGLLAEAEPLKYHRAMGHESNAKRIRKGKAPLYEWRTVELQRKPAELSAAPSGGTHASPRLHQRRGHWATSKLGKKFWRREAVVGNPENGMIFHDYKDGEAHA